MNNNARYLDISSNCSFSGGYGLAGLKIKFIFKFAFCPFTSICHIVHVVSMLEVPIRETSTSFQSADVSGAQYSDDRF